MKKCVSFLLTLVLLTVANSLLAQGTAFTYQGQLQSGGSTANGNYDFTFALFNNSSANTPQLGATLTDTNVGVTNGLFTVTLDFGSVFTGNATWLSIAVRTNGGAGFTALSPLQELTPTPYAIYTASAGSVLAANIVGKVSPGQLPSSVVTNGETGVNIAGTFSGNGAGVTNVNLVSVNTGGAITFTPNYGNFAAGATLSVGQGPRSVTAADVNGDGKVDLICANGNDNTLTVLTNNGSGGFVFAVTLNVGAVPDSVTAADVNGDGKVDLICADFFDNNVTVLLNNGSGGFVAGAKPGVGVYPEGVTAADVNGDGKVDLICANYGAGGGNTLTVLTNDGQGGFATAATPVVGSAPDSVAVADVNGDGKVDLICANQNDNTLTVLTNNGSGGFVFAALLNVGKDPESVTAADVNGDGKVDLICANFGDATLTVLTNNGSGGFALASTPGVGAYPISIAAVDVNGDGKIDLVCANSGGNSLTVLTNNGSGVFGMAATLGAGNSPFSVTAADVNGDGHADLICANYGDNTLMVFSNIPASYTAGFFGNGSGLTALNPANLTAGTAGISITGNATTAGLASNVVSGLSITNAVITNSTFAGNGAGLTNLNAAQLTAGTIPLGQLPSSVVTNGASGVNITGTFSGNGAGVTNVTLGSLSSFGDISWGNFLFSSSPSVGNDPFSVCAADVNGDGKMDLICANFEDNTLTVLTNNGSGGLVSNASYTVGSYPYALCAADVNGDGKVDLISANYDGPSLTVLTNNGSGGFVTSGTYGVGVNPYSVCAADVNGDGKIDLITANLGDHTLTVLTNNGSGGFVSNASYTVGSYPYSVCAADVNGDGKVDLICANYSFFGTLTVLTNNGSGGFALSSSPGVGKYPYSVCAADVNGDGKVDLICANAGGNTLTVLINNGSGGFVSNASYTVGNSPYSVCAADVNGDGKVDLICANYQGASLTVLTNNGSGGFVTSGTYAVGSYPPSVCAADMNGDGKVDLICANEGDNTLSVLMNTPVFSGAFSGDGSGLTGLTAANLTGALPAISGASLTSLNASQLTSGTIPLAQLPPAIAFLNSNQTFTGQNSFSSTVGIGTASPIARLSVDVGNGGGFSFPAALFQVENCGNACGQPAWTEAARLWNQNGNGRVGLGFLCGTTGNLTNTPNVYIGTGDSGSQNDFRIATWNGSGLTDRLYISGSTGRVGIGTTSPDALLTVNGTADKPGGGSWSTFSDARLKDVGSDFTHGMKALEALRPVHYHYKSDNPLNLPSQPDYIGVVAQQVQEAIPEAVQRNQDGYLTVNNDPIIWTMVNAIKEMNQKNEATAKAREAEIDALKQQNNSLTKQVSELAAAIQALAAKK